MDKLIIKKVNFYGDETASVTVDSGLLSLEVFCHPCEYREGDTVSNLLQVLDADIKSAFLADWPEPEPGELQEYIKQTGSYSYIGRGKVIDVDNGIIEVLGVRIAVDYLPNIPSNGIVEFNITRLDLW